MGRRNTKRKSKDDIDTMLRYVSRPHAHTLSRNLFGTQDPIVEARWVESQLAARQRRVDRAMVVKLQDEHRWQHIEWTERLTRDVRVRVYEYNHLLVMAAHADAEAAHVPGQPRVKPVTVDSIVVVLTGPKQGLPKTGTYRTSARNGRFSGVRFGIEAIYLRTVAEIDAMNSVFWLIFVPLAIDADEQALVRTIETLRTRTNPRHFDDLLAAMFTIAKLKKDRPNFLTVIESATRRPRMIFRNELTDKWTREGKEFGRKIGLVEGRKEGLAKAREEQHALLRGLVERRVRRPLTNDEKARFDAWCNQKGGAKEIANAVIDLSADELVARLMRKRPAKLIRAS